MEQLADVGETAASGRGTARNAPQRIRGFSVVSGQIGYLRDSGLGVIFPSASGDQSRRWLHVTDGRPGGYRSPVPVRGNHGATVAQFRTGSRARNRRQIDRSG